LQENFITFEQVKNATIKLRDLSYQHWLRDDIHKWTWWLNLSLIIIPIYIWWKFVDKARLVEIIMLGLFVDLIVTVLDVFGSEYVLWTYPDMFLPTIPRLMPIDYMVVPVVYMLIFQYYPKWKSYVFMLIVMSGVFSFLVEPLMIWLNLYALVKWKLIYSFPIYIFIGIFSKWFTETAKRLQKIHTENHF